MKPSIPADLTKLSLEASQKLLADIEAFLAESQPTSIAAIAERREIKGKKNTLELLIAPALAELEAEKIAAEEAEKIKAEEEAKAKAEAEKQASMSDEEKAQAEADAAKAKAEADEAAKAVSNVTVKSDENAPSGEGDTSSKVSEVIKPVNSQNDTLKEAFKNTELGNTAVTRDLVNASYLDDGGLDADSITRKIMAINTPGADGPSATQLEFVDAAACTPFEELRDLKVQGEYDRTILPLFRNFNMRGLGLTWQGRFNASVSGMVGEVDLTASPISKFSTTYACLTPVTEEAREVKAAFSIKEQTLFSSDLATEVLMSEAQSVLAATADSILLDTIFDKCHPFSRVAQGGFHAEGYTAVAQMAEKVEQSSPLSNIDSSWVLLVPKSYVWYAAADNKQRAYSRAEAEFDANNIFSALGVKTVVYDDFIDPTHTVVAMPTVGGAATVLTTRPSWTLALIRPDDGFVGVRSENKYGLERVPASKAELDLNQISFFARAWEVLGKIGPGSWSAVTLTSMAKLGESVAPDALSIT